MPLQNRVTPLGDIVADPNRGLFTGNRGIIHDPATRTLLRKRWSNPAWLICVCEFRGRRRKVMGGRSWTELFFLDEATALAAGHRPCFYCRRDDANRFRAAWEKGNRVADVLAPDIDAVLHRERFASGKKLHALPMRLDKLPDGAMVQAGEESFVIAGGKPLRWSFAGYRKVEGLTGEAMLITPPSTVRAMAAGFGPVLHPSAG
ncbi:MAG: hypothetical protein DI543_02360 [Bradyrhizobium icense]|jgi:hypothetical protein|nr:MAG: hypothetical protein DI543_02360 [Bradyrhizobium icense]